MTPSQMVTIVCNAIRAFTSHDPVEGMIRRQDHIMKTFYFIICMKIKDKNAQMKKNQVKKSERETLGLFAYPVLQAADILLYGYIL